MIEAVKDKVFLIVRNPAALICHLKDKQSRREKGGGNTWAVWAVRVIGCSDFGFGADLDLLPGRGVGQGIVKQDKENLADALRICLSSAFLFTFYTAQVLCILKRELHQSGPSNSEAGMFTV